MRFAALCVLAYFGFHGTIQAVVIPRRDSISSMIDAKPIQSLEKQYHDYQKQRRSQNQETGGEVIPNPHPELFESTGQSIDCVLYQSFGLDPKEMPGCLQVSNNAASSNDAGFGAQSDSNSDSDGDGEGKD